MLEVFLINTGLHSSDSVIKALVAQLSPTQISPPVSKRGKHPPKHKLQQEPKEEIKGYINMFNPAVSNYRREHARQQKYLPPELTVREMYDDFSQTSSGLIHYSTYQKIVHSMNISFAKLGEEECETCEKYKMHEHDSEEGTLPNVDMGKLKEKAFHSQMKIAANVKLGYCIFQNQIYCEDCKKQVNEKEAIFAADLEKVTMLPRMPGFKTAIFTRRTILFNETSAPLGDHIWHKGIRGRNDEDICSVYCKFLDNPRFKDKTSITIWADNCTAQNKNWTLFSGLVHYVNQLNLLETLMINFLRRVILLMLLTPSMLL